MQTYTETSGPVDFSSSAYLGLTITEFATATDHYEIIESILNDEYVNQLLWDASQKLSTDSLIVWIQLFADLIDGSGGSLGTPSTMMIGAYNITENTSAESTLACTYALERGLEFITNFIASVDSQSNEYQINPGLSLQRPYFAITFTDGGTSNPQTSYYVLPMSAATISAIEAAKLDNRIEVTIS